ncbi:MAG: DinB family protein [Bacillota bacterium]|nr:DinB family protein [Bacillota bacterium]
MTSEELLQSFWRHRKATQRIADLMPDERFGFRPYEGWRSFAELVLHVADATDRMLAPAAGKAPAQGASPSPEGAAAIRRYLAAKSASQEELVRTLAADPRRPVEWRGMQMPAELLLAQAREHEAHHKGQLMLLARLAGVRDEMFYLDRG